MRVLDRESGFHCLSNSVATSRLDCLPDLVRVARRKCDKERRVRNWLVARAFQIFSRYGRAFELGHGDLLYRREAVECRKKRRRAERSTGHWPQEICSPTLQRTA